MALVTLGLCIALGAGAGTGFLLGGGKKDRVENTLEEEMYDTINQNLTSVINASQNIACQNIQSLRDSKIKNCDVNFSEQMCTASIISSVTASNSFSSKTVQDMYRKSLQKASYENSQSFLKQLFDKPAGVSNFQKTLMSQVTNIQMHLETDCSQNISAVNDQSLTGVEIDCTQGGSINFDQQTASSEIVAQCAINQSGSADSTQTMTSLSEQDASLVKSGGYLWDIIILMLMIPLLLFLIPLAIRKGFTAFGNNDPRPKYIFVLTIILLLLLGGVWPGGLAFYLGMPPVWPYPYSTAEIDGKRICYEGVLSDDVLVNKFMWWDPNCVTTSVDTNSTQNLACTDVSRARHYESCGVFANVNACTDPAYKQDKENYIQYLKACSSIPDGLVTYCTHQDLARQIFSTDSNYGTCKRCDNVNDKWFGMSINGNADCNTANIDPLKYMAAGTSIDENGVERPIECPAGDTNCLANSSLFLQASPDDCTDPSYQMRKGKLSQLLQVCNDINAVSPVKYTPESPKTLRQQCGVSVQNFMDCNPDTTCNYVAEGCVCNDSGGDCDCSTVDQNIVRNCRNDFTVCTDENYAIDKGAEDDLAYKCALNWKRYQNMKIASIVIGAFEAFLLFIIFFFVFRIMYYPKTKSY